MRFWRHNLQANTFDYTTFVNNRNWARGVKTEFHSTEIIHEKLYQHFKIINNFVYFGGNML
jgi:hypothetical protein